jgi:hypothetical protein
VLVADTTQRAISRFVVAAPLVPGFEDRVAEDPRREAKVDAMVLEVAPPPSLIPFETVHRRLRYTFVYTTSTLQEHAARSEVCPPTRIRATPPNLQINPWPASDQPWRRRKPQD